jgi:hypothetical protein
MSALLELHPANCTCGNMVPALDLRESCFCNAADRDRRRQNRVNGNNAEIGMLVARRIEACLTF